MAKIGKYVVMGEVGRGASCIVYSTLDPDVGRQVAVKTVAKALAKPDDIARLQREAQVGGKLNHSHIASVYEYGEDDYAAWVAMEMVDAKSLAQHVAEGYQAPAEPLPELVVEILEALEYAHSRGVAHGDVRAENVLVGPAGAKLIGFGDDGLESADTAAAATMLKELFAEPLPVLDQPPATVRELLDGLRAKSRNRLTALKKAMKAAPAPLLTPRRLPAVLFVDDEERVLHALAGLFQGTYEVHTAASGAEALELIRRKRFLVIISDQRMPGMTGVELLREARTAAPTAVRLLHRLLGLRRDRVVGERERDLPLHHQAVAAGRARGHARRSDRGGDRRRSGRRRRAALRACERQRGGPRAAGARAQRARALARRARRAGGLRRRHRARHRVARGHRRGGERAAAHIEEPEALLHVLKKASPHTQLVAISEVPDPDLAIRLINEARIHRYLGKPVNLSLLQQAVVSGLQRYSRLENTPGLGGTERAKRRRKTHRLRRLFTRVRNLGGRFGLFNARAGS